MLITFYAIVGGDERYIGSTERTLHDRERGHKNEYNAGIRMTGSYDLYEKYGVENCRIEEIETRECATPEERYKREGELIRVSPNCVNKQIAGRSKKEYYADHYDEIREKQKEYYVTHKEEIVANVNRWREANYQQFREKATARQRERRRIARLTPTDL